MSDLGYRARKILYAAVTEFIATGEPVGSRTLAKKYGLDLSPASIRNVLSDLEELGYLAQPHTSAGRVPTERAFRFFVDTLMQVRHLSTDQTDRIVDRFRELREGGDVLREGGRLLSELTGTAAVVVAPRRETRSLLRLQFIPTRPRELLAVVVLSDGTVENRFLRLDRPIDDGELGRVHNLLADVVDGRTLGEVRDLFERRLQDDRVQVDSLRRRAYELASRAVGDVPDGTGVTIEGQARLLGLPEFADADRLRDLVLALEDRKTLLELLDRTIASRSVKVYVGREAGDLAGGTLSVVAASYAQRGRPSGSIGVLGPTRMDYPAVVPLVEATANAMSAALERTSGTAAAPATGEPAAAARPPEGPEHDPE